MKKIAFAVAAVFAAAGAHADEVKVIASNGVKAAGIGTTHSDGTRTHCA